MARLRRLADVLASFVDSLGRLSSWCFVALVGVIIFDVVTRRFLVLGSTKLQELEWHIHTLLFCLTLGFGYIRNTHVRVDIIRERLAPRTQAVIELMGIALLLLPFLVAMLYYGTDFAYRAFTEGEVSSAGTGLSHRWIVKAFIPLGFAVLLVAAIAKVLNCVHELLTGEARSLLQTKKNEAALRPTPKRVDT